MIVGIEVLSNEIIQMFPRNQFPVQLEEHHVEYPRFELGGEDHLRNREHLLEDGVVKEGQHLQVMLVPLPYLPLDLLQFVVYRFSEVLQLVLPVQSLSQFKLNQTDREEV